MRGVFLSQTVNDILLVGHRQAVAWMDEWHGMERVKSLSVAIEITIRVIISSNNGGHQSFRFFPRHELGGGQTI